MTSVRWRALLSLVSAAAILSAAPVRAADSAAHSIADKFAHDTDGAPSSKQQASSSDQDRKALERKLDDDARLRADEADMLERAKEEGVERRQAGDERKADAAAEQQAARAKAETENAERVAREAEEQRLAAEKAESKRKAAEEANRVAAEKRRAEEELAEDKAARERASREAARIKEAADAKRLAEEQAAKQRDIAATNARLEAERLKEAAEAKRVADEKEAAKQRDIAAANARIEAAREADAKRMQDAEAQQRMTAEREEEARRLSEKLTRAREQRAAKLGEGYSALGNPPQPGSEAEAPAVATPDQTRQRQGGVAPEASGIAVSEGRETRATILLVMEPGTRGIRRYEKTGDPIICIGEQCYVGNGVETAATAMTRGRALGPGNTLGQRAGACRHSLVCVFRDVDVGSGRFELQPIDMRILRHDRRETTSAEIDRSCTAVGGYLRCAKGVVAATYRVWVVPESVASKGGAPALTAALSAGLNGPTAADLRR